MTQTAFNRDNILSEDETGSMGDGGSSTLDKKLYLGDAVYAIFDGYHVWLTTENGISVTNSIGLDPHVVDALFGYITKLYEHYEQKELGDPDPHDAAYRRELYQTDADSDLQESTSNRED